MYGLKNIRLPQYNYLSDGWYFVTVVTRFRERLFDTPEKQRQCENIIRMVVHDISGASVDTLIVMSDHIHIIVVLEQAVLPLGEVIRRIKARTSYESHKRLWQPNYYEHIIRNEQALGNIRHYILENPNKEPAFSKRELKNGNIYMPIGGGE